jgi:hypothetical protein
MGGFIPRWFLIKLPDLDRSIPTPKEPDTTVIPDLADCLHEVQKLKGPVDLSRVKGMYEDWYNTTKKRFDAQPNSGIARAFWNRHRVHLLKLAAIYSMSEAGSLTVSHESMERAIESARKAENTIFSLIKTGLNREGAQVDKLEQQIKAAGVGGLPKSEFTRAFQDMRHYERGFRLQTLLDAKVVESFSRSTAGRRAEVLVHKDYVEEHRLKFPKDNPNS